MTIEQLIEAIEKQQLKIERETQKLEQLKDDYYGKLYALQNRF